MPCLIVSEKWNKYFKTSFAAVVSGTLWVKTIYEAIISTFCENKICSPPRHPPPPPTHPNHALKNEAMLSFCSALKYKFPIDVLN